MRLKIFGVAIGLFLLTSSLFGQKFTVSGSVVEKGTFEPLTGATVVLEGTKYSAICGLDGSFKIRNVDQGDYTLQISFISYQKEERQIHVNKNLELNVELQSDFLDLDEFEVISVRDESSEVSARSAERNAMKTVNAISAKAIERSPDVSVADVVQRVSGLTVERNNSGDAQYAIVRGMDKRYNYTLVNGVKIPSPDNENRYVPLDIFPAELLDQLEVSKTLTPDMEGDAIGGVVNMKMKRAPSDRLVSASFTTGYNEIFLQRSYDYFDPSTVDRRTPMERAKDDNPRARFASEEYYNWENLNMEQRQALPNMFGSLALGNRFLDNKLGVVVAGSYQNSFRGSDREEFGISETTRGLNNMPRVTQYQQRRYSTQQERAGVHSMVDFTPNKKNRFKFYNVWLHLQNNESRIIEADDLRALEMPTLEYLTRGQINVQRIFNSTLQGEHDISKKFTADWSVVYSRATQEMPDNSQVQAVSNYDTPDNEMRWLMWENIMRVWESNYDQDYSAYYNLTYSPRIGDQNFEFKTGGMVRMKDRENFFDMYTFKPNPGVQEFVPYETNMEDITWRLTGAGGTPTHVLNYQSYENIYAQYGQFKFYRWNTTFLGGVRAEYTDQGYSSESGFIEPGSQEYLSVLPSLNIKHALSENTNLRASYFRSISRPSFLEIVPYRRPSTEEIRPRGGNPNLTHVDAHNFDLRYEFFPTHIDQILVGAFYKVINNPIELAILPPTSSQFPENLPPFTTIVPINLDIAINQGLEIDVIKYFNKFGVRANYTFTMSEIESTKRMWTEITDDNFDQLSPLQQDNLVVGDSTFLNVSQTRPLQGQSRHLGNLSLLYKNESIGLNAQLSMVYTGERIAVVSTGYETDWWQREFIQLDFSLEKEIGKHFVVFCKINNLLNTPMELYIKQPHVPQVHLVELQPNSAEETLVMREFYQRMYLFGVRYRL